MSLCSDLRLRHVQQGDHLAVFPLVPDFPPDSSSADSVEMENLTDAADCLARCSGLVAVRSLSAGIPSEEYLRSNLARIDRLRVCQCLHPLCDHVPLPSDTFGGYSGGQE